MKKIEICENDDGTTSIYKKDNDGASKETKRLDMNELLEKVKEWRQTEVESKKTLSDKVGDVNTFPHHEVLMLEDVKDFIEDILYKVNRTQSMKEVYDYIKERSGERFNIKSGGKIDGKK